MMKLLLLLIYICSCTAKDGRAEHWVGRTETLRLPLAANASAASALSFLCLRVPGGLGWVA
eukprot:4590016-Amphidinium_carterae.1